MSDAYLKFARGMAFMPRNEQSWEMAESCLRDAAEEIKKLSLRNEKLEMVSEVSRTFLNDFCEGRTCTPGALKQVLDTLEAKP